MNEPEEQNWLTKYLSLTEIVGWILCICGMLVIVFAKELSPESLPFAWAAAIIGAGILGWGMGRKHKRK